MKIEIEWTNSYDATMTIDGKPMKIEIRPGLTRIVGLDDADFDRLGGRVAEALYTVVADCMQAQAAAFEMYWPGEDDQNYNAWSEVSEDALEAFDERVS